MSQRDDNAELVLRTVSADVPSNLKFFGVGVLLVLLAGSWLRLVAILGLGFYLLLFVWNAARTASSFLAASAFALTGTSAELETTERKFMRARFLLLVETVGYAAYVSILYLVLF